MKYLKMFESFDNFYSKISYDEFAEATKYSYGEEEDCEEEDYEEDPEPYSDESFDFDKLEIFTNNELLKIKEEFPNMIFNENGYEIAIVSKFNILRTIKGRNKVIQILKCKDEWFYIAFQKYGANGIMLFYKCDQFEGLIRLVKEKLI